MSKKYFSFSFFILLYVVLLISFSYAATDTINDYVVDNAHVFDSDVKIELNDALKELEITSGGIQVVVFTEDRIPTDTTLEERSLEIATKNGIGSSDSDNGLLLYLATSDRQFRWEVGYGLESQLNSAKLGRISRDYMVPKFKEGNFQDGIIAGLAQVEEVLIGNQTSALSNTKSRSFNSLGIILLILFFLISNPIIIILVIILIIYIIKLILRKKGIITDDTQFMNATSNLFNTRGRGGFSGGGFSGGGGHFGGGGFSGRF